MREKTEINVRTRFCSNSARVGSVVGFTALLYICVPESLIFGLLHLAAFFKVNKKCEKDIFWKYDVIPRGSWEAKRDTPYV